MKIDRPERARYVLAARLRGDTWAEIAEVLGISRQAAYQWGLRCLTPAMDACLSETVKAMVRNELAGVGLASRGSGVRGTTIDAILAALPKPWQALARKRRPTPCGHSASDNTHYVARKNLPTACCGVCCGLAGAGECPHMMPIDRPQEWSKGGGI